MSPRKIQGRLFAPADIAPAAGTVVINARCVLSTRDGMRAVVVAGVPTAHFAIGDRMAEAYAMVTLVEQGWADQDEVALAFGCATRTVRRAQRRFEEGGLPVLGRSAGYPKGRARVSASRVQRVTELKAQGVSNRAIATRLGVTEKAVRKLSRRLGWKPRAAEQDELLLEVEGADPNVSASASTPMADAVSEPDKDATTTSAPEPPSPPVSVPGADPNLSASAGDEPLPVSYDTDPADRRIDRILAYLGFLHDAAPLFRSAPRVPRAGVLLALPALLDSGVLDCAHQIYGGIGPAFYGLRTSIVAMLLMALLRIKRPESLKEHSPEDLGRLVGLDRAPEVKTLRRKLTRLASLGLATDFGRALSERRVAARGASLGYLYVDGHVRVYHGERTIPKAHVARMRIAMPATTDYWVNDAAGEPVFVITAEANAGMVAMLPPILDEVRSLVGDRRVTIVFDRGGYSARLFAKILASGFDILTYRKGRFRRVPKSRFHERRATIDGLKVDYLLADQEVRLRLRRGWLQMRQVTRLSTDGRHQTPILTSRRDLRDVEVAARMFSRWRQENFFKYLREEYALDALADHRAEPADATREVPNPRWNALDAELRRARAAVAQMSALYGLRAWTNVESLRKTMRGFKIAHAAEARELLAAVELYADLDKRRAATPRRVPVAQAIEGPVVRLATERKHLTNLLKMVAYQAESDLCRMLAPHYKRADDEGRTLVQTALVSAATLEVTDAELRVTLAPLSSPHRSRAIAALCEELNRTPTRFPGTALRLRFAVEGLSGVPEP